MLSKSDNQGKQLVHCHREINGGDTVFLNISDEEPVSLFGGRHHAEKMSDKGEVIFNNRDEVKNSPNSWIAAVFLSDGKKAFNVGCFLKSAVVLGSNGRVFSSSF